MGHAVIYPGTFDPITHGHSDLIERASKIFNKVVVAIASNINKHPLFSLNERIEMVQSIVGHIPNVEIIGFDTLLASLSEKLNISIVLRGLRAISDFEYEFQLANMNRHIGNGLETVFLTPAEQYSFVSSSLVKEVAMLGGDVSAFVSPIVVNALQKRQPERR